ncbi:MAG: putative prephenate dehydrogenase [Actinomycetota bacterium]
MADETKGTINVLGLGLIGASVASALSHAGWTVHGEDADADVADEAVRRGIISVAGLTASADVSFVATPVTALRDGVERCLALTNGVVTDVGSVKAPVTEAVSNSRYVPGHPMAGSELEGLDGADSHMFEGAIWVLTPSSTTDDQAFATVASLVASMGAEVMALSAREHDRLVAVVSHVPHLAAATLMRLAGERSEEHASLLRLAAGGFRDMTRIASGRSGIWLDICDENRAAIVESLDSLISGLAEMRNVVSEGDREGLKIRLDDARRARTNLPSRAGRAEDLSELRTPIPDRPGAAAEVFVLCAELGVNVFDFEVVHSAEGNRGVMVVVVRTEHVDLLRGGLIARGFGPAARPLSR